MIFELEPGEAAPTARQLRAGGKNTSIWRRYISGGAYVEMYFLFGAYVVRYYDGHKIWHRYEHRTRSAREARALFMNDAILLMEPE